MENLEVTLLVFWKLRKRCERKGYNIRFSGKGPFMREISVARFEWIETPALKADYILEVLRNKVVPRHYNKENTKDSAEKAVELIEEYYVLGDLLDVRQ